MDARDRLFADIAARLELLSREQLAACMQHGRHEPGKRLGEIALELGFLTTDELALVRAQEARAIERNRPSRATGGGLVEERGAKRDPRSASAPPVGADAAAQTAQAAPAARKPARRGGSRTWQAPEQPAQGQIYVPRTSAELPPPRSDTEPLADPPKVALSAPAAPMELADTAPGSTPDSLQPSAAARASRSPVHDATVPLGAPADVEGFPLAQGHDSVHFSDLPPVVPAQPATPAPVEIAAAVAPAPVSAPAPRASSPFTQTAPLQIGFAGNGPQATAAIEAAYAAAQAQAAAQLQALAAREPLRIETPLPPKAVEQRPAGTLAASETYLGKALALAIRQGASDLHAHSGAPLMIRVDGQLRPLGNAAALSAEAAEKVIAEITTDAQWTQLAKKGEVDFACELPNLARFRVNVYRQQRGIDAVFRIIPQRTPALEELGLPARLARLMDFRTGMVLCTGPAGCGKSTTLAALLGSLAHSRADHVLTIEDPVEFVLPAGRALVNQRQVREHTSSFARALRAALREDPDVIAITELRDRETIALAISAAETGHLVLGTLHTGSAAQTIHRIVSSFPQGEQEQMRVMLAESLRAVISQRLVPMASGRGRVPAIELLMVTTAVSNLIREDKTHQLPSVMQTGKAAGMVTLDDSLDELVRSGMVTSDAARRFAVRKERFA